MSAFQKKKKLVFRQMSQSQIPRKKTKMRFFSGPFVALSVQTHFKSWSNVQNVEKHHTKMFPTCCSHNENQICWKRITNWRWNIYSYYNHNKPSSQKPQKSSKIEKWTMFFSLCCFFFTAVQHLFGGGQLFNFVLQFLKAAMVVKKNTVSAPVGRP